MIKDIITRLIAKKNLKFLEAKDLFDQILALSLTPAEIAAILVLLKAKGETGEEIFAAATAIREKAVKIEARNNFLGVEDKDQQILDTCGTGGSGLNKFNISTTVAFIVSAAGVSVAKHGNRAMSSHSGSADLLESLGVKIQVKPEVMAESIKKVGIGFLYAPLYHPALVKVAQIRRELGIRTIFNILGPLSNPAGANYQLLGAYSRDLAQTLASVLKRIGLKKALVVCGRDVGDEISLSGPTDAFFLNNKKINKLVLNPSSFGLKKIAIKDIIAKDLRASTKMVKDVLEGKKGPARNIVLANASACFYILGKAKDFRQGVKIAADIIDTRKAKNKLLEFKSFLDKNA